MQALITLLVSEKVINYLLMCNSNLLHYLLYYFSYSAEHQQVCLNISKGSTPTSYTFCTWQCDLTSSQLLDHPATLTTLHLDSATHSENHNITSRLPPALKRIVITSSYIQWLQSGGAMNQRISENSKGQINPALSL